MIRNAENPHGGDVYSNQVRYDFSVNVSPLGTPKKVTEALENALTGLSAYPDAHCDRLLEQLSSYEKIPKEWMICGNGASDLIYTYARAVGGKKALIVAPTFCEYANALEAAGVETEYFMLSEKDGFVLEEAGAEQLIRQLANHRETASVWICNPNNPTGKVYSYAVLTRIAETCRQLQMRLFVDECFMDFTDEPKKASIQPDIRDNPYVFLLKAFTKNYCLAGVRLGYGMCSDEQLLERMCALEPAWNVSSLAQAAGIAACNCIEFLQQTRQIIQAERSFLQEAFRQLGFKVAASDVNFILFQADVSLYAKLLKQGILIRDCSNFKGLELRQEELHREEVQQEELQGERCYYRCAIRRHEENVALVTALRSCTELER